MSWKDKYRQGSFRGIPFDVKAIESGFGRRQVTHEYPAQDLPFTEDLGRKYDEFTVDAYVIGSNYDVKRDRLIAACRDEASAGVLVHPYLGEKMVYCKGLRVRESSDEGGMAVLSMTFIEAGLPLYPSVVVDSAAAVSKKAEAVKTAAKASFLSKFTTSGPGFLATAAAEQVRAFGAAFNATMGPLRATAAEAAELARDIYSLQAAAEDIVLDAELLMDEVTGAIGKVRSAYQKGLQALDKLLGQSDEAYAGSTATPARKQQQKNHNAFLELVRSHAIAEASTEAVEAAYGSYEDAIDSRDLVLDYLDTETETTDNDDLYSALQALRAEVARGVPDQASQLPRLITVTPTTTTPALVLAYRLYGDASREEEIVARNLPRHPGFLIGGEALEVLSNAE